MVDNFRIQRMSNYIKLKERGDHLNSHKIESPYKIFLIDIRQIYDESSKKYSEKL